MSKSAGAWPLLSAALSVSLLCASGASATTAATPADVWWEKRPPAVEEISAGKLHVGDRITKETADLVKDYLPESFYRDALNGAVWEIAPHTPGSKLVIPALLNATSQNKGKAVVSQSGTVAMPDGSPWTGGFPNPEPQTGLAVMVNRQFRNSDGKLATGCKLYWVNPAGQTYKTTVLDGSQEYTTARVCQGPRPAIPGYENELFRELVLFTDPYDVRGLSVLSIVYVDQGKLPDAWGYIPVLRRAQRFSSAQRYDSSDGSDLRAGDFDTFSDPLGLWDFKLVGRRPLFSSITGGEQQAGGLPVDQNVPLIKGKYPEGAKIELRDTYIVEAIPKDQAHIYSRKILFVDAATWTAWLGQFYDRQSKLWLAFSLWFKRLEADCGNFLSLTWVSIQNHQTNSATLSSCHRYWLNPEPGKLTPDMFTLKFLMSQGR